MNCQGKRSRCVKTTRNDLMYLRSKEATMARTESARRMTGAEISQSKSGQTMEDP